MPLVEVSLLVLNGGNGWVNNFEKRGECVKILCNFVGVLKMMVREWEKFVDMNYLCVESAVEREVSLLSSLKKL